MLEDIARRAERIKARLAELRGSLDWDGRQRRIGELEARSARPDFWDDPAQAQKVLKELGSLREPLERWEALSRRAEDLEVMVELAEEAADPELGQEAAREASALEEDVRKFELERLLTGRYDDHNAILTLHAGAGGTEAQDWTEMLLRMYTRWAEARGYKVEILDTLPGEEAGLKSATVAIRGPHAYGFLRPEMGVHRLVRISPFDAAARRHTSFAAVEVTPEVEDDGEVEIRPEDLRIDTFRSSGAGGQHVNKTESAVRITHLPTGIVVSCQQERSQIQNREVAMRMLRSRLAQLKLEQMERELGQLKGPKMEIEWGSQIRSYVFQPYTLVKDHRTGYEVGNIQAVMDGEIDGFIYAYLQKRAAGELVR
ncbi:peptide chain release factor 2 [Caldinitratiruptor microaerophilus]|uniref:peptide chain release factor 2 n=1 Tax=Caldinitratiruptor microaerophilus TaxID=671077 RepID=UPI003872D961